MPTCRARRHHWRRSSGEDTYVIFATVEGMPRQRHDMSRRQMPLYWLSRHELSGRRLHAHFAPAAARSAISPPSKVDLIPLRPGYFKRRRSRCYWLYYSAFRHFSFLTSHTVRAPLYATSVVRPRRRQSILSAARLAEETSCLLRRSRGFIILS